MEESNHAKGAEDDEGRIASHKPVEEPDLSLRADHFAVTRLSRKALIGLGGGVAIILGAALIFALQTGGGGTAPDELFATDQKPTADSLASLPKDYGDIPKLGPPLPGDLGKPILDAGAEYELPPPVSSAEQVDPAIAERQRKREAALASQVFVAGQTSRSNGAGSEPGPASSPEPALTAPVRRPTSTTSSARLKTNSSPYILQSGSIIAAALITGIRSDLPGQITAQVTQNVYDSVSGDYLLIPQGTKLIGSYDSNIGFGQNRLGIYWTRLILPNGKSLVLDKQPGGDAQGFSGVQDGVDYHWGRLALAAGLSTVLAVGSQAGSSGDSDIARAIRDGVSDTAGRTGDEIVKRQLAVPPTLTIRPGYPVRVMVSRDLILEPYQS
ncbi:MAG: TrbI/VirB10 family protein [Sphingorhabdus sp.]